MLITFSSQILARFQTGPLEILAAGKILTTRNFVSRRNSHRDIRLPAKNPGKTPAGILPRFWPSRIPSPTKNPGKTPAGIPPRFWPPGSRFLPRIPARFPPGSRQDFGCRDSRLPARFPPRFWPPGIPPPSKNPSKNPGGQNLGGIPAGILPGSCQDPAKILVPFLQGNYVIFVVSSVHGDNDKENLQLASHVLQLLFLRHTPTKLPLNQ